MEAATAQTAFFTASGAQPHELRVEVGGLSARSGPGALNDRGLQPGGTHTQAGRAALAGAFLVARAQAGPGARRCAAVANRLMSVPISDRMTWALSWLTPGMVLSCLTSITKGGEPGIDLPIDRGDAGIERVDLLQMEIEQKAMVSLDAPAQGFAQPCLRRPDLGMRERG